MFVHRSLSMLQESGVPGGAAGGAPLSAAQQNRRSRPVGRVLCQALPATSASLVFEAWPGIFVRLASVLQLACVQTVSVEKPVLCLGGVVSSACSKVWCCCSAGSQLAVMSRYVLPSPVPQAA